MTVTCDRLAVWDADGFTDAGCTGPKKREQLEDRQVEWSIAAKRSKVAGLPAGEMKDLIKRIERLKAQARSRVEHVFHLLKDRFHHRKLRYQGLKKNGAQHHVLFALANLVIAKKALFGRLRPPCAQQAVAGAKGPS